MSEHAEFLRHMADLQDDGHSIIADQRHFRAAADHIARLEARVEELEGALAGLASEVDRLAVQCLPCSLLDASREAMRVMAGINHSGIPNSSPCKVCGGKCWVPITDCNGGIVRGVSLTCPACHGSGKDGES